MRRNVPPLAEDALSIMGADRSFTSFTFFSFFPFSMLFNNADRSLILRSLVYLYIFLTS